MTRSTTLASLPAGLDGTRETLKWIRHKIRQGKIHDDIRSSAVDLVAHLAPKDHAGEILALFNFVHDEIRYVWDTRGVEHIHNAENILRQRAGDCDDKVIILGALLESIGHPTKVFAIGFRRGELSHVVLLVWYSGAWVALDATEDQGAGWLPDGIAQTMEVDNGDDD